MSKDARESSFVYKDSILRRQIYIAATGQHKGKTTCTLGVVSGLQRLGYNVGFCKPVGQQHLTLKGEIVDKDAVSKHMNNKMKRKLNYLAKLS